MDSAQFGKRGEDYSAGLRVYDISDPANPRAIGFMEVEGLGLHRIWWIGDRYAYASAFLDGYTDHVLIVIDMHDLDPARARSVAGGFRACGTPGERRRIGLAGSRCTMPWWWTTWPMRAGAMAGVTLLDVKDKSRPRLIAHRNWYPPFAGGTHSALPLHDRGLLIVADEAVQNIDVEPLKYTWVLDIRAPENPVTIATMPVPSDQDYHRQRRPLRTAQSLGKPAGRLSEFALHLRDVPERRLARVRHHNPFRPEEVGWFVPALPQTMVDTRPGIVPQLHTADVYVEQSGLAYITDFNAGLHIVQNDWMS